MIGRATLAGLAGALLTFVVLWLWLPTNPPLTPPGGAGSRLVVVMERLGAIWTHHESWSMRSINFREAASPRWLDSLVVQVGLWVAISSALWLAWSARAGFQWRRQLGGCLALLLLGWLVLDLHWQGRLLLRLQETRAQYAGLSATEAARTGEPEASFARAADALREQIPETPARVVLITLDPGGYVPLRVRYHLLPLNVPPGTTHLPAAEQLRTGDFLLLIEPPPDIGYHAELQELWQGETRLAAELVLGLPGAAHLFRVL